MRLVYHGGQHTPTHRKASPWGDAYPIRAWPRADPPPSRPTPVEFTLLGGPVPRRAPTHADLKLGKQLRAARLTAGLTVRQLASQASVSPGFISLVENGQRSPAPDVLERMATTLLLKPADLHRSLAKERDQARFHALSNSSAILQSILSKVGGAHFSWSEAGSEFTLIDVLSDEPPFEAIDSLRLPVRWPQRTAGPYFALLLSKPLHLIREDLRSGDLVICSRRRHRLSSVAFAITDSGLELVPVLKTNSKWRSVGRRAEVRPRQQFLGVPIAVLKALISE